MKKIVVLLLAALYFASSTGVNIRLHYCMGELADWAVDHAHAIPKKCGNCGMEKSSEKNKGCCKDDHKFVKDNSAQKITESSLQLMAIMATAIMPLYAELPAAQFPSVTEAHPATNGPPRSSAVAVYILHRAFLI